MNATAETIDHSTALFRALADPTRLRLLNLLRDGERCVCELVDVVGGPQPKTSRHLAHLRKAGLVVSRRRGQWIYYRLAEPTTELHRRLINCVSECFGDMAQLQADRQRMTNVCRTSADGDEPARQRKDCC